MSQSEPLGPFKLVTVNTSPERARKIIGRLVEAVKDKYTIVHAANCEGRFCWHSILLMTGSLTPLPGVAIKDVASTVEEIKPDLLVRSPETPKKPGVLILTTLTVLCLDVDT